MLVSPVEPGSVKGPGPVEGPGSVEPAVRASVELEAVTSGLPVVGVPPLVPDEDTPIVVSLAPGSLQARRGMKQANPSARRAVLLTTARIRSAAPTRPGGDR